MIVDLSNKELKEVSKEIWQQTDCEELYLNDNHLTHIPESINQFKKLRILDLSNNFELTQIPNLLDGLENLEYLNLGQTGFNDYPKGIFTIYNLKTLKFLGNNLPHLPKEIARLQNLKNLYLEDVCLETIHPEIAELQSLEELSLLLNSALTKKPEWINYVIQLKSLKFLSLRAVPLPKAEWTYLKDNLPNTKIHAASVNYFGMEKE